MFVFKGKIFLICSLFLVFTVSDAESSETLDTKDLSTRKSSEQDSSDKALDNDGSIDRAKSCLYNSYTAQKAFHAEYYYYATSLKDLGVSNCSKFEISLDVYDGHFVISLSDKKSGKKIGFINDFKQLHLYDN